MQRHFRRVSEAACLAQGQRVIELGAGAGRFTVLLVKAGLHVLAVDLSHHLLGRLRKNNNLKRIDGIVADISDLPIREGRFFDRAVGFFVLHHLQDPGKTINSLRNLMKPGGRIVFCEPNPWNPSHYVQIAVTPGMSWQAEKGILQLWPNRVLKSMRLAGFVDVHVSRYGFFPPLVYNTRLGQSAETWLERTPVPKFIRAFQIFSGVAKP